MAHTIGQWRQHPEHPDRIIINGSGGYEVRDATSQRQPNQKDVALMAAAPDLLAALRRIADASQWERPVGWLEDLWPIVNAALDKAEGR